MDDMMVSKIDIEDSHPSRIGLLCRKFRHPGPLFYKSSYTLVRLQSTTILKGSIIGFYTWNLLPSGFALHECLDNLVDLALFETHAYFLTSFVIADTNS